jgi:hypothetical protein
MTVQLFEDGKLKWTMEPVGDVSQSDFVILPKTLMVGGCMSADAFDRIFWANVTMSNTNRDAYEKAEQLHQQYFERRKYSDYETYKSSKSQRMKK